jgi:hypothetical protein
MVFLDSVRFDDLADGVALARAALASPEGQAVVADLSNVATGGVTVLLFDDTSIRGATHRRCESSEWAGIEECRPPWSRAHLNRPPS